MRKRLRKKRRLGEFREFGFHVSFHTPPSLSFDQRDAMLDGFIEMIEHHGLQFGGGGRVHWSGFVALDSRGTATESHREIVRQWLRDHPQIEDPEVGPLIDAWHDSD